MHSHHSVIRSTVEHILRNADAFTWQLQGFGMLRLYLPGADRRLHVWSPEHAVENVSELHDHPWDFDSYVVAGAVNNYVFTRVADGNAPFDEYVIQCGVGGGIVDPTPRRVYLDPNPVRTIPAQMVYGQMSSVIHASRPEPGTVTICTRQVKEDADHAHVFVPAGEEWISAEPRDATDDEVAAICSLALDRWFR